MKGARTRWPAAAALAAFFAAGCDYWRNLVDDKPVTRVPLAIEVRDAWTGNPLADVYEPLCEDSARGIPFPISDGRISISEAATGPYTITCRTGPGQGAYYERSKTFDVGRSGGALVMDMARRGGQDWYPEDREKQVSFPSETLILFPAKGSIRANPFDTSGAFEYHWSFAANSGRLNRGPASEQRNNPIYGLNVLASDVQAGPDTLTLTVKSYLGGRERSPYTVGSSSAPFRWVRNLPPQIEASLNSITFRLGCGENLNRPRINFRARDPDAGICDSVVFETKDANVVFNVKEAGQAKEVRRLVKICNDTNNPVLVRLTNPFTDPSTARVTNRISVTAWDGNGETSDTVLEFSSDNNDAPKVEFRKLGAQSTFFPFPEVQFSMHVNDDFGVPKDITVDWGDGTRSKPDYPRSALDFEFEVRHIFQDTGFKIVTAYVTDACDTMRADTVRERIHIIANSYPRIFLDRQRTEPVDAGSVRHSFYLSVADANFDNDGDSLTKVFVSWGDGADTLLSPDKLRAADLYLAHLYPLPASGSVKYPVTVSVEDANRGYDDSTFQAEISRP